VTTWTSLEPQSVTADAGGSAGALLRIRNTGDVVEEYHVDVVGEPAGWCTVEPSTLRLYPGTTEQVRLTFAPPRGPDPAAGPHPYGVRISPRQAPDAVTVTEGNVSVAPFTDVRAELLPVVVRGWRKAKPQLVVDNYGNTKLTASIQAAVQDQSIDFETRTPSFQVEPGRAHFAAFTGRPNRTLWFGRKVNHPFTATVTPSGSEMARVPGTYVQTALLPSWMSRLLVLLLALLIAFIALWLLARPSVTSEATAQITSSPAAVTQPTTPAASPSHSATPSAPASQPAIAAPTQPAPKAPAAAGVSLPAPISWWPLNDGKSTAAATAHDTEGHNPATGTGDVQWCSPSGGCAYFDDSNSDFATSGTVLKTGPNGSFTVAAWVYLQSIPANGGFATAVSQSGNTDSSFYLQYDGADGCWAFARPESDSNPITAVRAKGCTNNYQQTWVYLTGTFNASNNQMTMYVNGKQTGTATDPTPYVSTGPLIMGRALSGGNPMDWWYGCMHDVKVYGSALSSQQVSLLFSQHSTN
jgi:hypothetical protein